MIEKYFGEFKVPQGTHLFQFHGISHCLVVVDGLNREDVYFLLKEYVKLELWVNFDRKYFFWAKSLELKLIL